MSGFSRGIQKATSTGGTVTITGPTGPVTDFEVSGGGSISEITSNDGSVTISSPTGPDTDLSVPLALTSLQFPPSYYTGPDGGTSGFCLGETADRSSATTATIAGNNGQLKMCSVFLQKGDVVSKLGWFSGTTGATLPLNQWLGLFDNQRNLLANTADQTTAAIAGGTGYQYPIAATAAGAATSFTCTYTGLYYIGLLQNATTAAQVQSTPNSIAALMNIAPIRSGLSSNLTAPPPYPFQGSALVAQASVAYEWAA